MKPTSRGSILLLVLVFGSIFFIILGALVQLVVIENRAQDALIGRAQSFSIAEAGLEYYAWFLAHFPDDLTNGTGNPGPHTLSYTDPTTGGALGTYTLSFEGASACGDTQLVDITSTGTSAAYPNSLTTLVARFAAPTVAQYKQIVNDGSAPVSFTNIQPDFAALKTLAQAQGIYIPQHLVPQSPHLGYRLIFNADNTVTVRLVTAVTTLRTVEFVDNPGRYSNDYTLIATEEPYQTFPIPDDCGLIFSEDNTWIDGVVSDKVTVVAATFSGGGSAPNVILLDDITYSASDGSAGLTVIGEKNIIIAPNAPNNLTLQGIFVAASGYFGRNSYYFPSGGCNGLYEPRGTLTLEGTIVSNYAPRTRWPNGCFPGDAGYQTFTHTLDPDNATNPPPYTPSTSAERTFISWQQTR